MRLSLQLHSQQTMDYCHWYYGNYYDSPYAFNMRCQDWTPHRRQMRPRNWRPPMWPRYSKDPPMLPGYFRDPPMWNQQWNSPPRPLNGSQQWNSPPRSSHGSERYNSTPSEQPCTLHRATGLNAFRRQETLPLEYELTQSFAVDPTVFDDDSPGIDFHFPNGGIGMTIEKGKQVVINTHVIVKLPKGIIGVMMDKSSKVTGKQLKVEAGLIDTGYRGEISIVLRNMSEETVEIEPGEAIAQMLLLSYGRPVLKKVEKIEADTNRGTRGFGKEQPVERKAGCEIL